MNLARIVLVLATVIAVVPVLAVSAPCRTSAQTVDLAAEVTAEVDGKDASLALLEFVVANRAGRSCGAKRSKLVVTDMGRAGGEVQTTDQRPIPESDVLELARALPPNENVIFLYHCEIDGSSFFARAISISHVEHGDKSGWNANLMKVGNALDRRPPLPASLNDDAVALALQEASRQINDVLPQLSGDGARLDRVEVHGKALTYRLILDAKASDVNARKFKRAMKKELTSAICKEEVHLTMLRSGVVYEYRYVGKDGASIASVAVNGSDCR